MKLLICRKCEDTFNLTNKLKTCSCGEISGKELPGDRYEINGDCRMIAFNYPSLYSALRIQRIQDQHEKNLIANKVPDGVRFEAYVISKLSKYFEKK